MLGSDWELAQQSEMLTWAHFAFELVDHHRALWRDQPTEYWFRRLVAEVGELAAALADDHEHPWELEAAQVAAIALNMLRHKGGEIKHAVGVALTEEDA